MTRDGEIVAIVEEKEKWTLSTGDIVTAYYTSTACNSALNQLYHYMRLNHRKYGILSSYEHTWFVYRCQNCAVCQAPQGHETLYVSDGIPYTSRDPTVLQCISYFNTIVDHSHMDSPPTSKRSSRANSATQISRRTSPVDNVAPLSRPISPAGMFNGRSTWSEIRLNQEAEEFDVDEFRFDTILGEGRCKVYLDNYNSQSIALKTADIVKNQEALSELRNEVAVYEHLSELQGNGIPFSAMASLRGSCIALVFRCVVKYQQGLMSNRSRHYWIFSKEFTSLVYFIMTLRWITS
jgi:hypothetical protein